MIEPKIGLSVNTSFDEHLLEDNCYSMELKGDLLAGELTIMHNGSIELDSVGRLSETA